MSYCGVIYGKNYKIPSICFSVDTFGLKVAIIQFFSLFTVVSDLLPHVYIILIWRLFFSADNVQRYIGLHNCSEDFLCLSNTTVKLEAIYIYTNQLHLHIHSFFICSSHQCL